MFRLLQVALTLCLAICVGFIAMWLSRFFIPKSVGLAGGAMVLMYGVGGVLLGFILGIILVRRLNPTWLRRLTLFFGGCTVVLIGYIFYQVAENRRASERNMKEMQEFSRTHKPTEQAITTETSNLSLGVGLVSPLLEEGQVVKFYEEPESKQPIDQIQFVKSEHNQLDISPQSMSFAPLHLKLDYQVCLLRVLEESEHRFRVVVNEDDNRALWVDKTDQRFQPWSQFILSVFAIEPLDIENNPLREDPMRHAAPLPLPEEGITLRPLQVQNEWVQVALYDKNQKEITRAWLRWRSASELLIEYSLFS